MISGVKRQGLTLETVLHRTSEYDIYRYYLGHDFKLGEPFSSPFHEDRDPSFSIICTRNGRLHFTDFADSDASGKVIDFVRRFYPGRRYDEILKCIDRDLNLGICTGAPITEGLLSGRNGGEVAAHYERSL
ncbi:MAG TPA: hypothetical protein VFS31_16050, partial [Chitinophagaceae bacterium]|nr:hypothetical protein [Chitinophagaceae bacterium]